MQQAALNSAIRHFCPTYAPDIAAATTTIAENLLRKPSDKGLAVLYRAHT